MFLLFQSLEFCRGNEGSCGNENRKLWKKCVFCGIKSTSILLFFLMKIKMIDL